MNESSRLRIAKILNDREVAVTGGTVSGLEVDDVLKVVASKAEEIRDPDTSEVLGKIVRSKAVVRVYEVQERFALARTFRTRRVNIGGSGVGAFAQIFDAPRYETRVETLRRDPSKSGTVGEAPETVVEVGDIVEKVEGPVDDVPSAAVWR